VVELRYQKGYVPVMSIAAFGPTQLPFRWVPAAISLGGKVAKLEADHSPPSSTEVNIWSYTSALP
jgi:hypothetical protein